LAFINRPAKAYRLMFFTGALWNWGAAILFFLAYKPIFAWLGMKELNYPLVMYAFLILVFVFGVGYYWVSKDISKKPTPEGPALA